MSLLDLCHGEKTCHEMEGIKSAKGEHHQGKTPCDVRLFCAPFVQHAEHFSLKSVQRVEHFLPLFVLRSEQISVSLQKMK